MDLLNNFNFPPEAREFYQKNGMIPHRVDSNVSTYEAGGHDRGLAYRFFTEEVKNQVKSEDNDFDISDTVELVEWFRDRKNRITERVKFLPEKLLKFSKKPNAEGVRECIGGLMQEAYLNFKKGLSASGLALEKWGEVSNSQIFTLKSAGIFTVQQFAALSRDRVDGVFPPDIVEKFEAAIKFVNGQKPIEEIKKYADQVFALKQEKAKQDEEIEKLKIRLERLMEEKEDKRKKV